MKNKNLFLFSWLILAFCLMVSCTKNNKGPQEENSPNQGEISYWYNNQYFNYKVNNASCSIRRIVDFYNGKPHRYYVPLFPFSSAKTAGNLQFYLYNDTLYPHQQFRPGTWKEPYEQYEQTFFTSNDLTAMIPTHSFSPYNNYFYANQSFAFTIDTVANGTASGRFEGNLVCYSYMGSNPTQHTATDTIKIEQGMFNNISVLNYIRIAPLVQEPVFFRTG